MTEHEIPGMLIVYTGNGKGKTTAALGLCLRAVGHGRKVGIIQFLKSDWPYGELTSLERLAPDVTIKPMGVGCIGILGDDKPREEHRRAAREALQEAHKVIAGGEYDIVILDEITIATHMDLLSVDDVLAVITGRPEHVSVVVTGRYADEKLIAAADLVTEMKEIKHPFQKGQLSRKGIDY
jgi:cob(I)alamin adenosyltransferase